MEHAVLSLGGFAESVDPCFLAAFVGCDGRCKHFTLGLVIFREWLSLGFGSICVGRSSRFGFL
jgi:hypothetical protein